MRFLERMARLVGVRNRGRRRGRLLVGLGAIGLVVVGASRGVLFAPASAQVASGASSGMAGGPLDCVNVIHVFSNRGLALANAFRFSESRPTLQTDYRLGELTDADLRAFCDWQACIAANGYAHACALNDAGWEVCRVCDSAADCAGQPTSPQDCVDRARTPDRTACHAGLLQECLLQRAMRGPRDARLTQTCFESDLACAGQLAGDRSGEARAARHETDQVAVEVALRQMDIAGSLLGDAAAFSSDRAALLAAWDGGLPTDLAPDGAAIDDDGAADGMADADSRAVGDDAQRSASGAEAGAGDR
jgi:hypothetical protein